MRDGRYKIYIHVNCWRPGPGPVTFRKVPRGSVPPFRTAGGYRLVCGRADGEEGFRPVPRPQPGLPRGLVHHAFDPLRDQAPGRAQAVLFGGLHADGVKAFFFASEFFMMQSRFDTFGMVALEAMAARCDGGRALRNGDATHLGGAGRGGGRGV